MKITEITIEYRIRNNDGQKDHSTCNIHRGANYKIYHLNRSDHKRLCRHILNSKLWFAYPAYNTIIIQYRFD